MQTNGTLIDREIAREIKKMNIAIGISMDGPFEVNEKLRGRNYGSYKWDKKPWRRRGKMVNLKCSYN